MLIKKFSLEELYELLQGNTVTVAEFDNFLSMVRQLDYLKLQYEFYSAASKLHQSDYSGFTGLIIKYHTAVIEHCERWLAMERMFIKNRGIYFNEDGVPFALVFQGKENAEHEKYLALAEYQFLAGVKPFFEDRPQNANDCSIGLSRVESDLAKQTKAIIDFLDGPKFKRVNQVIRLQPGRQFSIINTDAFFSNPFLQACADGDMECIRENLHRLSTLGMMKKARARTDFYNSGEIPTAGHDDVYYAIHLAVVFDQPKVLEALLRKENQYPVDQKTMQGETALHIACRIGAIHLVKMLLAAGADVNIKGIDDRTPLHEAAAGGHTEIVGLLLEQKGIKLAVKDKKGNTPLHDAITMPLPWDPEGRFTLIVNDALLAQEVIVKALVAKEPGVTKIINADNHSPLDLVFIHQTQFLQEELPGSQLNASPGAGVSNAMGNLSEQRDCITHLRTLFSTQNDRRLKAIGENLGSAASRLKIELSVDKNGPDVTIPKTKREQRLFELRAAYVIPTFKLGAQVQKSGVPRTESVPAELAAAVAAAKAAKAAADAVKDAAAARAAAAPSTVPAVPAVVGPADASRVVSSTSLAAPTVVAAPPPLVAQRPMPPLAAPNAALQPPLDSLPLPPSMAGMSSASVMRPVPPPTMAPPLPPSTAATRPRPPAPGSVAARPPTSPA